MNTVHPKVKAAALIGAVVTAIVAVLAAFGIVLPAGVASAVVLLASTAAGYFAKPTPRPSGQAGAGELTLIVLGAAAMGVVVLLWRAFG